MKKSKKFLILMPLITMIIVLCFFVHIFHKYDEESFTTLYQESKCTVDMMADTVESFKNQGYVYNLDSDIYSTLIRENTINLNKKPGVNLRILDLSYNIVYEDEKIKTIYSQPIFSPESPACQETLELMKSQPTGERRLTVDNSHEVIVYWRQIPAPPESQHYLVLSVDKDLVINSNIYVEFIIGVFVISIILIISLWDSVALRLKK